MSTHRKVPLVTGEIYHVFNRGIDKRKVFTDLSEYVRSFQTLKFYRYSTPPLELSKFLKVSDIKRYEYEQLSWGNKLVSVMSYCLMPNHLHLLLRQEVDGGISTYLGRFFNSYTRYFNTKHERVGPLFLDDFKNVLVESEEQFLHLSRYIHLNPYSSGLVKSLDGLLRYEWSSLKEYVSLDESTFCDREVIMSHFFYNKDSYKKFVLDRADYQKGLKIIENSTLE